MVWSGLNQRKFDWNCRIIFEITVLRLSYSIYRNKYKIWSEICITGIKATHLLIALHIRIFWYSTISVCTYILCCTFKTSIRYNILTSQDWYTVVINWWTYSDRLWHLNCSIVLRVPKCAKKTCPTLLHQHQQPELLMHGRIDPCFYVV